MLVSDSGYQPLVIAINGTCSVGKSTLSRSLADHLHTHAIVPTDGVFKEVMDSHIQSLEDVDPKTLPCDLISLFLWFSDDDRKRINNQVIEATDRKIRDFIIKKSPIIHEMAICSQDEYELSRKLYRDCRVVRVFVHGNLDNILSNTLKRNETCEQVNHRSLTLPFEVIPLMYRSVKSDDNQDQFPVVCTWEKNEMTAILKSVEIAYTERKGQFNTHWITSGDKFFSNSSTFLDSISLHNEGEPTEMTYRYPHDIVVNPSDPSLGMEGCVRKIVDFIESRACL